VLRSLVAIGVAIVVASSALAGGIVRGVVTDEAGAVIPGSVVRLLREGQTATQYRSQTNQLGEFKITGVTPGKYTVRAYQVGFVELAKIVSVSDGTIADAGNMAFKLAGCDAPHVICDAVYAGPPPNDPQPSDEIAREGFALSPGCTVNLGRVAVKCLDGADELADLQLYRTNAGAIYLKAVNRAKISDCGTREQMDQPIRLDGLGPGNDWCVDTNAKHHAHVFLDLKVVELGDDHVALWVVTRH
jgi:hypothetical protein